MNSDQIGGLVRTVLVFLGGIIVSKGWIPVQSMNEIVGGLVGIIVAVWSWKTNSTSAMVASVADKPEVQKVVAPSLASSIPNPAVTAS
jgi:hypothetical protein